MKTPKQRAEIYLELAGDYFEGIVPHGIGGALWYLSQTGAINYADTFSELAMFDAPNALGEYLEWHRIMTSQKKEAVNLKIFICLLMAELAMDKDFQKQLSGRGDGI